MLISIITPTYNRAHTLERTIASVLAQSYQDWELLVVDDASRDKTPEVMSKYSDPRVRYIKLQVNKGNAGARNAGVTAAAGKFVTFVDSDDELEPGYLKSFVNRIDQFTEKIGFAFCGYTIVHEDGKRIPQLWHPVKGQPFLESLKIGIGCGVFIRKTCFDQTGLFDENLRVAVDTDFLIRLEADFEYFVLPEHLVRIHFHSGDRVRRNTRELLKSYERIVEKNVARLQDKPATFARMMYKIQWLSYHAGETKRGNRAFGKLVSSRTVTTKAVAVFLIFNLLPTSWALKIHKGNA